MSTGKTAEDDADTCRREEREVLSLVSQHIRRKQQAGDWGRSEVAIRWKGGRIDTVEIINSVTHKIGD